MNLGEIVEAAIGQVIPLTSADQLVNANKEFVRLMANKAYKQIERRTLWKFSEAEEEVTATSGVRVCADVPVDFAIPLEIFNLSTKQELTYHDERQGTLILDQPGSVKMYGLWKDELRWYPLPKATETLMLKYYKSWPELTDDSDEPIIPSAWQYLIVDYASGQLARRLPPTGDRFLPHSKADPWIQDFLVGVEEMANSDLVLKTWDRVPNYEFENEVLGMGEW